VVENAVDDVWFGDERDYAHLCAAGTIWRFVLVSGMKPVTIGLVLGIGASLAATRLLRSQVYDVNTLNPIAFLLPTAVFTLAGLCACAVPSVRASKVDPVGLLRSE